VLFLLLRPSPPPPKTPPPPPVVEKPAPVAAPLRARFSVTTTPPGAEVVRVSDGQVLGKTPWSSEEDATPGLLDIKLRLPGYADRILHLDRSAGASLIEMLEPSKDVKPGPRSPQRPFGARPAGPGGKMNPGGKKPGAASTPAGPTKDDQPRIVD
jgi:hypothetical protein